jgi:DNA-binding transcriptional LysR family regulator
MDATWMASLPDSARRRIAVNVPHWLLVPHLLQDSALLSVLYGHLATRAGAGLVLCDLPFPGSAFTWSLYWLRRNDASRAQQWLRARLTDGRPNSVLSAEFIHAK